MPQYNKTIWKPKDVVTVEKLENIENGIFDNTLPNVTIEDNNKVLVAENSQWVAKKVSNESGIFVIDAADFIVPSAGSLSADTCGLYYGVESPEIRGVTDQGLSGSSFIYSGDINKLIQSIPILSINVPEGTFSIRPEFAYIIETKPIEAYHRDGYEDNALLITNSVRIVSLFFSEYIYNDSNQVNLIPPTANIETCYIWGPQ